MKKCILPLIFLLFFLASCVRPGDELYPQEGQRPDPRQQESAGKSTRSSDGKNDVVTKWQRIRETSKDLWGELLVPLFDQILSDQMLSDAEAGDRPQYKKLLDLYLRIALHQESSLPQEKKIQLANQMKHVVEFRCEKFSDTCLGVNRLKASPYSAELLIRLAKIRNLSLETKTLLVKTSVTLTNAVPESEQRRAFFVNLIERIKSGRHLDGNEQGQLDHQVMILTEKKDPEEIQKILEDVGGFRSLVSVFKSNNKARLNQLVRLITGLDKSAWVQVNQELLSWVEESLDSKCRYESVRSSVKARSEVSELLGKESLLQNGPELILMDGVFCDLISPYAAAMLAHKSEINSSDILRKFPLFNRVHILSMILNLTDNVALALSSEVPLERLIQKALTEAALLRVRVASELITPVDRVGNFIKLIGREENQNLDSSVEVFQEKMKKELLLAVDYPHTWGLLSRLSERNFNLSFFGKSFDSSEFFLQLFNGDFLPIFDYVGSVQPIGGFELVTAFDWAVRLGVFERLGVNPDQVIALSIDNLTQKARTTDASGSYPGFMKAEAQMVERLKNSSDFHDMKRQCENLKSGQGVDGILYFSDLAQSPLFGGALVRMSEGIFATSSTYKWNFNSSRRLVQNSFFLFDGNMSESIEGGRLDVDRAILLSEAFRESYRAKLVKDGLSESQIDKKLAISNLAHKALVQERDQFFSHLVEYYRFFDDCYFRLLEEDLKVQGQLIEYERAFLRAVHQDILALRAGQVSQEEIDKKYRMNSFPEGYGGRTFVTKDGVNLNELDTLARIGDYLVKGNRYLGNARYPALAPRMRIEYGDSWGDQKKKQYIGPSGSRYLENILSFSGSERRFVEAGLRYFLSLEKDELHVSWQVIYRNPLTDWSSALVSLMSLAKTVGVEGIDVRDVLRWHSHFLKLISPENPTIEFYRGKSYPMTSNPTALEPILIDWDMMNYRAIGQWQLYDFPLRLVDVEILGFKYALELISHHESDIEAAADMRLAPRRKSWEAEALRYAIHLQRDLSGASNIPSNEALIRFVLKGITTRIQKLRSQSTLMIQETRSQVGSLRKKSEFSIFDTNWALRGAPYVNERLYVDVERKWIQFDSKTDSCFTEKGCKTKDR